MPYRGGFAPPNVRFCRYVAATTWRRFLFVLFNQNDNQGQNRKNNHEKFIIAHTITPSFVSEGDSTPCRNLPAQYTISKSTAKNNRQSHDAGILNLLLQFFIAALVLTPDGHDFMRVEQIPEGIGSIPRFMLPPHAVDHRSHHERIDVYEFDGVEVRACFRIEPKPLAAKKSAAPHEIASQQSLSVSERLYSSPSTPYAPESSMHRA